MSAKQMFEKLGYTYKYLNNSHRIEYFLDKDEEFSRVFTKIVFYKRIKKIETNGYLSLEELQAINQQVKELGWLDE